MNLHAAAAIFVLFACAQASAQGADAVAPGEPAAVATLRCIGIFWPVEGDRNGNAACSVRFRKAGQSQWREALPLHRKPPVEVDVEKSTAGRRPISFLGGLSKWGASVREYAIRHWRANYLAGSIFDLEAATSYEISLRLEDPDNKEAVERTLTVATRAVPLLYPGGGEITVRAEDGSAGLSAALEKARPGDTVLIEAGTYAGPVRIGASGAPGRPIVVKPAGDGAVIIKGEGYSKRGSRVIEITGSHLHLHDIDVRDAVYGVWIGEGRTHESANWAFGRRRGDIPADIAITRCRVSGVQHAIVGTANECYIADNALTGLAATARGIDWSEGEGVEITGSGTVVCHNRMRELADGVSIYPNTCDQDVYRNDVSRCSDDGIELDYCDYNNRVWCNKFNFAGNNGISFQPHIGGPGYIIRNQVIGFREGCIKDRYGSSDVYFFHNTFVGHKPLTHRGRSMPVAPTDLPMRIYSRNNLYLIAEGLGFPVIDIHEHEVALGGVDMDYEGLGGYFMVGSSRGGRSVDRRKYAGARYESGVGLLVPVESFSEVAGVLSHYTFVEPENLFEIPLPPYRDWRETGPEPVMRLKEGAPAIDAGTPLPNVNEAFAGKAPDLGAVEYGMPEGIYGPRPAGAAPYETGGSER